LCLAFNLSGVEERGKIKKSVPNGIRSELEVDFCVVIPAAKTPGNDTTAAAVVVSLKHRRFRLGANG
jgi:NaMN:DMB phosphoribosyltransferase